MTIKYSDLREKLGALEDSFGGDSTRCFTGPSRYANEIRKKNNFQCFALDTTTSGNDLDLPVIVAIGANYCDGNTKLPIPMISGVSAVEEDLSNERRNYQSFFNACNKGVSLTKQIGFAKPLWEDPDGCPVPIETNAGYLQANPIAAQNFHLVMTNFSPWITHKPWSYYRDNDPAFTYWLIQDGLKHGHLEKLYSLIENKRPGEKAEKKDPIVRLWLGHGCYDIYWFFRMLVVPGTALGIGNKSSWNRIDDRWTFTSNSSQSPESMTVW